MKLFDLHKAYTRVSRVSLCLLATFALSFTSCEKDIITPEDTLHTHMQAYYVESRGLTETSADSVVNYYTKFAGFHNQNPECEADEYFPPIVHNLDSAFTHFGIVQIGNIIVKTEWDGEIFINF